MKILFLDFDGVLHPEGVYRQPISGRIFLEKKYADEGHKLFEHANLLVELIEKSNVDVQIVLSTSWVSVLRSFKKVKQKLPAKLQEKVTSATWHSAMDNQIFGRLTRYQQIMRFVERNNVSDSDWVAIDDNNYKWNEKHQNNLLHTNEVLGLGKSETQQELVLKLKGEWK